MKITRNLYVLLHVENTTVLGICINIVLRGRTLDFMCSLFGDRK